MIKTYTIKSRLLWLAIISILMFSCSGNSEGFKKDLQIFKERGWSNLTDYNFKIDERGTYRTGNGSNIFLRAVDKDTFITLEYLKSDNIPYPPDFNKVFQLKKQNDTLALYRLISFDKADTLYDYTITSKKGNYFDFQKMVFKKGKYYFMYKMNKLNLVQQEFYEEHKDSLDKIRGNNLPELPRLSNKNLSN